MSQFKTPLTLLPLAALLIAFQNCSPAQFTSADSASSKVSANITPTIDGTSPVTPPTSSVPPQPVPPTIVTQSQDQSHDQNGDQDQDHDGPTGRQPGSDSTADNSAPATNPPSNSDDDDYRAACGQIRRPGKLVQLSDGLNIENHAGSGRYIAGTFGYVNNNSGAMVLACTSAGGLIKTLDGNSGMTVVCGCDVGEVKNHSGKLVVVGGTIGSVENSSGLVVIDGQIQRH